MVLNNKKLKKKIKTDFFSINKQIEDLKSYYNFKSVIPYGRHFIDNNDIKNVNKVLRSDLITQGPQISVLENKICQSVNSKYAVAVSSASTALHLSCLAAGLKKNEEMITSPITFIASSNAALFCNAKPKFSDIDRETINISQKSILKSFKNLKKIKIIMPVHLAGYPCEMKEINSLAKKNNIKIIEDASHALGARYKDGSLVGSNKYSLMTVFSLHPVKIIAAGEGGIITTNDKEIYKNLLKLRSHGIEKNIKNFSSKKNIGNWFYEINDLGFNYRITDIQASLAISQLDKLKKFVKKRRDLAKRYHVLLNKVEHIKPAQNYNNNSSYHLFIVRVDFKSLKISKKELVTKLLDKGVVTQVHYIPVPTHQYYQKLGYNSSNIENAMQYYEEGLSIPIYYNLSIDEQNYIINVFKELII